MLLWAAPVKREQESFLAERTRMPLRYIRATQLRKISPFGRNDKTRCLSMNFLRALRATIIHNLPSLRKCSVAVIVSY
jgi:hypothetical protein